MDFISSPEALASFCRGASVSEAAYSSKVCFFFRGRGLVVIQRDPDSQGKEVSLWPETDSNGHQASFQTERNGGGGEGVGVARAGK